MKVIIYIIIIVLLLVLLPIMKMKVLNLAKNVLLIVLNVAVFLVVQDV